MENPTTVKRTSDFDLTVTRSFNAAAAAVFAAWTTPHLFKRWWAPQSSGLKLLACDMDVRTGGSYRLQFSHPAAEQPFAFFGSYIEVIPNAKLVWTNEESEAGAVTTVTLTESQEQTELVLHERHPTKEACEESCAGMEGTMPEQFRQLDGVLGEM